MKKFDIEMYLKQIWGKVDHFYKQVFLIFFVSLNIVFLYNFIYCLFGIHDIYSLFDKISPIETFYIGRYSVTLLEYLFSNRTVIPFFTNIILFFFLSLATIFTLNWLKVRKSLSHYLFSGLFLLLTPCIYVILWYRTSCFGHLMSIFFLIVSFFISEQIENEMSILKKSVYFFTALLIVTVFVFGSYPPAIGVFLGMIFSKIFMDYIDNDFSELRKIIVSYKYIYIVFCSALVLYYFIFTQFKLSGLISSGEYNVQIINLFKFFDYLFPFFVKTFHAFIYDTFPYIEGFFKFLLLLIVLVACLSILFKFCFKKLELKSIIKRICIVIFCLFLIFYSFNIVYFISPVSYNEPRFLRLEYWTTIYFVFVCIVFSLKYSNVLLKNILFIILFILIITSVQINMHIQKDQMIAQQIDLSRVMTLRNLIMANENYEYTTNIKYEFVRIGNLETAGYISFYNSGSFNNNHFCELSQTFLHAQQFHSAIVNIPPKITNINPYKETVVNSILEINDYMNDTEFKNWFLNDAMSYPSLNSVFINKGKIYVIMNQKVLDGIKIELRRE